jgi:hypothetical protein
LVVVAVKAEVDISRPLLFYGLRWICEMPVIATEGVKCLSFDGESKTPFEKQNSNLKG